MLHSLCSGFWMPWHGLWHVCIACLPREQKVSSPLLLQGSQPSWCINLFLVLALLRCAAQRDAKVFVCIVCLVKSCSSDAVCFGLPEVNDIAQNCIFLHHQLIIVGVSGSSLAILYSFGTYDALTTYSKHECVKLQETAFQTEIYTKPRKQEGVTEIQDA